MAGLRNPGKQATIAFPMDRECYGIFKARKTYTLQEAQLRGF